MGLYEPKREYFFQRVQHIKWLAWYNIINYYTMKNNIFINFMNWGYCGKDGKHSYKIDENTNSN